MKKIIRKELKSRLEEIRSIEKETSEETYKAREVHYKALAGDLEEREQKVYLSYSIGHRSYYAKAYKIGAAYVSKRFEKITRSTGYSCIEEIPAITEKMKEEMYSDSMYY